MKATILALILSVTVSACGMTIAPEETAPSDESSKAAAGAPAPVAPKTTKQNASGNAAGSAAPAPTTNNDNTLNAAGSEAPKATDAGTGGSAPVVEAAGSNAPAPVDSRTATPSPDATTPVVTPVPTAGSAAPVITPAPTAGTGGTDAPAPTTPTVAAEITAIYTDDLPTDDAIVATVYTSQKTFNLKLRVTVDGHVASTESELKADPGASDFGLVHLFYFPAEAGVENTLTAVLTDDAGAEIDTQTTTVYHRHANLAPFKMYADGRFGVAKEYFTAADGVTAIIPKCVAIVGSFPGSSWTPIAHLTNQDALTGSHDGYLSGTLPIVPNGTWQFQAKTEPCSGEAANASIHDQWDMFGPALKIADWMRLTAAERKFASCNYLDTARQMCVNTTAPVCGAYMAGNGTSSVVGGGNLDALTSTMSNCSGY